MAKRQKDRQYNGQKTEGQKIQWPNKDLQSTTQKPKDWTKLTPTKNVALFSLIVRLYDLP